ncbi:MAG: cytochrome c [Gammaproteobacteria bacterium]|nr:MAG: cytochrome c [Gammaproteobacteria bacterium]
MGLLDDKQIDEIAAWIASTAPAKTATAAPKAKEALTGGAKLFQEKTCWSCHGKDAKTPILPIYPNLTGLSKEYILNQMKDIKSGKRANGQSAAMKGVMGLVDDKQIEEIATWLATLK